MLACLTVLLPDDTVKGVSKLGIILLLSKISNVILHLQ